IQLAADVIEQQGGDVALTEVRDDCNDLLAGVLFAGCDLYRTPYSGASGDAAQDAFLDTQCASGGNRILDAGIQNFVVQLGVENLWDEVRAQALDLVRAWLAAIEDWRILWLNGHDLQVRVLFLQVAP